jgi:hypothetical protein
MATISACPVGSALRFELFWPSACTCPSRTITAPKGLSAFLAWSIAICMKRESSWVNTAAFL